jgi:hypothetical protein
MDERSKLRPETLTYYGKTGKKASNIKSIGHTFLNKTLSTWEI